ncbi:MAG: M1 family metallopeptidase, partial [bacterium]|nr:M1 family metallopeptidase [bacterium]
MFRRIAFIVSLLLLTAACAGPEPAFFESIAIDETSTSVVTTTAPPTTTTAAPAVLEPTPIADLLGLGDSRYPALGNGGYDVDHYDVDLTFDPGAHTINALVTVEATATTAIDSFSLDFIGFEVTEVTVDGEEASFERENGELIITTPSVIAPGVAFAATVAYNGTPTPVLSEALPFNVGWRTDPSGVSYVVGEPDGGHTWLPLNDHPSDKATYTFRITVPDPLIAAANGVLAETVTDLGWATWVWESEQPMASYLATVVIGDLDVEPDDASTTASGVRVRNVIPDDLSAASLERLALHGDMIRFLEHVFGP